MTLEESMRASGLPWIEARMLAQHALRLDAAAVVTRLRDPLDSEHAAALDAAYGARLNGQPIAYILGEREFYGQRFAVSPAVLIPRPETELLCERLLERLLAPSSSAKAHGINVLDLGCGSGAIAITIAAHCPAARIMATDISADALALARQNAAAAQVAERISFVAGNWFDAVGSARFDWIASNPPYIASGDAHLSQGDLRYEPRHALASGASGLDAIRTIVGQAPAHLNPGGGLIIEHGFDQGPPVRALMAAQGYREIQTHRDDAGHERVTCATWAVA